MNKKTIDFRNDSKTIAANFGTPTYIVYEEILKKNYKRFYSSFKQNWRNTMVAYSVKTNYLPAIVSILHSKGANMEVVSGFELYLASETGVPPSKIIFNGPSKTLEELDFAIRKGVFLINADSLTELQRINKLGKQYGKVIDVGIRVNVGTAILRRFGIPLEYAEEVFKYSSKLENIKVRGVHTHLGTNISRTEPYVWALDKLLRLVRNLQEIDITIDLLDIGGGFPAHGVGSWGSDRTNLIIDALSEKLSKRKLGFMSRLLALFKSEKPEFHEAPPIETYAKNICTKLKEKLYEYNLPPLLLVLEPGRCVVNSAVTLLVRVVDIKNFREKWVMVDGGTNLVKTLGFEVHRVLNVTNEGTNVETVKLAGPLCYEGDILRKIAKMSVVNEGDVIEIFDVGAYSISQSTQFIKPRAGVVLVRESGDLVEVRRRESYRDLIRLDAPFFGKFRHHRKEISD